MDLSELRREYRLKRLEDSDLAEDPLDQFDKWFKEALQVELIEPAAMQLATVGKENRPCCRTVLLRAFDDEGFRFFTNYGSRKAHELSVNPDACLVFYWKDLERQVIIEGTVKKTSRDLSEKYFERRSRKSQIAATASMQSKPLESREVLENECERLRRFHEGKPIPCPPFWGGYNLKPSRYEFWQGRENRMHDRFEYVQKNRKWLIQRLWP